MYPPESHALRDLPFEMAALSPNHSRAWVDLDRGVVVDGVVSLGALTTVADVLAGSLCGRAIAPDWMATSALSVHLGEVPSSGVLVVDAQVARLGRTALVIQLGFAPESATTADGTAATTADTGASVGEGVASFTRLPRRDSNLDITAYEAPDPQHRLSMALPGSGLRGSFEAAVGTVVVDAATGATLTPVVSYVQNSFGAVNGGIVAGLADIAARSLVDLQLRTGHGPDGPAPTPSRSTDVSVQYLSQVRQGQVRTAAQVVGAQDRSTTVRVELRDAAIDPQDVDDPGAGTWTGLMAVAHVTVQHPG